MGALAWPRWRSWRAGLFGIGICLSGGCGAVESGKRTPEATRPDAEVVPVAVPDATPLVPPEPSWLDRCAEPAPEWIPADTRGREGESVLQCLRRLGPGVVDDRIPLDQIYELTTFGGPGDEQPTQCEAAPDADGTWFYAANRQRFGCGTRARLVNAERSRCVVVEVADLGPHLCVEEAGKRPAWDVSPLAARHLFGVPRAGWSEHRRVIGAPVSADTPLGPCDAHLNEGSRRGSIGTGCTSASDCGGEGSICITSADGWPGGYCTQACTDTCPEMAGGHPLPACASMPGEAGRCVARCDFTLFEAGCRAGYACLLAPHPDGRSENAVCAPARCG